MKVFKFGGASISCIERIHNVANIIQSFAGEKLFIIISAMGKTTNNLEKVVETFFEGNKEGALALFNKIKQLPASQIQRERGWRDDTRAKLSIPPVQRRREVKEILVAA